MKFFSLSPMRTDLRVTLRRLYPRAVVRVDHNMTGQFGRVLRVRWGASRRRALAEALRLHPDAVVRSV